MNFPDISRTTDRGAWRRRSVAHSRLGLMGVGVAFFVLGHATHRTGALIASTPTAPALQAITGCDASITNGFKPDANTKVTLVKFFKKGDMLTLLDPATAASADGVQSAAPARGRGQGGAAASADGGRGGPRGDGGGRGGRGGRLGAPATATNDVCVVKLLVGPGHPGPADAPSTSAGIGIEIWLPSAANWNKRIHMLGSGGCGREGTSVISLTVLGGTRASTVDQSPARVATEEGAVSALNDTGHTVTDCSFGMNPDGSINTVGWMDFSRRSLHEMAMKTKALTAAYYGSPAKYTYFEGFSTGGRQAETIAQMYPDDVGGLLGGAPSINSNSLSVGGVYPSIVYQRELNGVPLTGGQRTLMGNAAISACDMVGGVHLGYITDPATCTYDPEKDSAVLCATDGGTNTGADCVTKKQAHAQNMIWYGQTSDGSVPSPAVDNGWSVSLKGKQRWYGHARGATDGSAGNAPFGAQLDKLALAMENSKIAAPSFINATGNGENLYKTLTYAQLSAARDRGEKLDPKFGYMETNNPDLSALKTSGTKFVHYHGLADNLIPPQGSIHYYNRAAAKMGGIQALQNYYRFYLVPSMAHGLSNGSTNSAANPPIPTHDQLYQALTDWVEKGIAPGRIDIATPPNAPAAKSRPICPYPQKATYRSGDPNTAASYSCS